MSSEAPKICSVCSSVGLQRSDFERPPFEPEGRYNGVALTGTLGYLRRTKDSCSLCRLIAYALYKNEESSLDEKEDETEWEMIWRQANDEYDPDSDEASNFYGSGLFPSLRGDGSYTGHCIQLVDEASTDGFLRGRLIPEMVDTEMIRGWLKRCAEKHGKDCKPTYLQIGPHPKASAKFMVIDVDKECLVNMPPGESYVALSYVWGQTTQPTTVKSLVSEFQKPGAFEANLPRTTRDAIDITRDLGFHYLWVDSLCIVQDDDETKGPLISNMDTVYGHAALTIIAASGSNVEAGLQGWRSSLLERQLFIESIGPDFRLGVLPYFDKAIMQSPHAQRGWTYQEGCLSSRCLVILDGKAFFSCRATVWREDVNAEVDDVVPLEGANTLGRTPSPWHLRRYAQHVGAYTERQLTYQSDALKAFAGIGKALAASMACTRIFYAMPAMAFDWAILWTGSLRLRNLKRRSGFPSWAWVGWKGEILMMGDTFSSFDQHWLLERTWIEWSLITESREIVSIWDPERDQSIVSPLGTISSSHTSEDLDGAAADMEGHREKGTHRHVFGPEGNDEEEEEDPDIDQSDDRDDDGQSEDEENCPTYGHPTPSNPYGRRIKPQLLSILPAGNIPAPTKPLNNQNLPPGTLIFSAVVASFSLDTTSTTTAQGTRFFLLHDTADRVCGFIWDDIAPAPEPEQHVPSPSSLVREIFLLSQASPGAASILVNTPEIGFADEYRHCTIREEAVEVVTPVGAEEPDGEYVLDEWHCWDFFNVMLPLRVRGEEAGDGGGEIGVYERAGIGLLHVNALGHASGLGPQWRTVLLQ